MSLMKSFTEMGKSIQLEHNQSLLQLFGINHQTNIMRCNSVSYTMDNIVLGSGKCAFFLNLESLQNEPFDNYSTLVRICCSSVADLVWVCFLAKLPALKTLAFLL